MISKIYDLLKLCNSYVLYYEITGLRLYLDLYVLPDLVHSFSCVKYHEHIIWHVFLLVHHARIVHIHEKSPMREEKQRLLGWMNLLKQREYAFQHSHGIRAHKKWSISTASRSQFPIQRITQERISELQLGIQKKPVQEKTPFIKLRKLKWILIISSSWRNNTRVKHLTVYLKVYKIKVK